MGVRIISDSGGSHIYQPAAKFRCSFERVRIDRQLLTAYPNRPLMERLEKDDRLLDELAEISAGRGLPYLNILDAQPRLKFVQQTCRAMIIPIEILDYALREDLPLADTLGIPDYVNRNHDEFGVNGEGKVLAFRGAYIGDGVRFATQADKPIILRENSELWGELTLAAGQVVKPGEKIEGRNLFLPRPLR